jgi:hypothetical protein
MSISAPGLRVRITDNPGADLDEGVVLGVVALENALVTGYPGPQSSPRRAGFACGN